MTRRLAIWLIIFLVFAAMIAAAASTATDAGEAPQTVKWGDRTFDGSRIFKGDNAKRNIALVPIYGEINSGDTLPNGTVTGSEDTVALLRAIRESGEYDGIILEVDTPGGGVLPSAEIAAEVRRARKESDMIVVAWMRDVAASGGYYISAQADEIVAAPTTITGSIGVIMELIGIKGLAGKIGINAVTIKSGKLKDMGSPFRDLTGEERAVLQRMIDEAYGDFLDAVSDGRGMSLGDVRELADGRIYTGRQAKQNGLVDSLGTRFNAYDIAARLAHKGDDAQDITVTSFERRYSFYDLLGASTPLVDGSGMSGSGAVVRLLAPLLAGNAAADTRGAAARPVHSGLPTLQYRAVL